MNKTNQFGLKRDIPESVKRAVRQRDGFGCIVCANAIYEFEHIDPEFKDAKEHAINGIILLCPNCHRNKTKGIWSIEKIKEHMCLPAAKKSGESNFELDIANGDITFQILDKKFIGNSTLLQIYNKKLITVGVPAGGGVPVINATFYDSKGLRLAKIVENEWISNSDTFDITFVGRTLRLKSQQDQVDLEMIIEARNILRISKLNYSYQGVSIVVDEHSLKVTTPKQSFEEARGISDTVRNVPAFDIDDQLFNYGVGEESGIKVMGKRSHGLAGFYGDGSSLKLSKAGPDDKRFGVGDTVTTFRTADGVELQIANISVTVADGEDT